MRFIFGFIHRLTHRGICDIFGGETTTHMEAYMTPQLLIFLGALIYLGWVLFRYWKRRNRKDNDAPFIEVVKGDPKVYRWREKKKREAQADREWRKRVQDEIEDLTK